ncbi:MAG: type II toxin-antitoxin system VapC family toxin [bacterium]
MKPTVYIETSVISYLTARQSRDLRLAADQAVTRDWWQNERIRFELFASPFVISEAQSGDPHAASLRMEALKGISLLKEHQAATPLASSLLHGLALPDTADMDAFHIAMAAVHGIDYLLTWNCRHINNAVMKPRMRVICRDAGFDCPEICTPVELSGGDLL